MGQTTRAAIPFPELSDPADANEALKALAERVDASFAIDLQGTLAARPVAGVAGRFYTDTTTGIIYRDDGINWRTSVPQEQLNPTGIISPFAGSTAPPGWLLCDGAVLPRSTYAALFGVISTTYGAGDGSSTFGIPDLRGRVPAGVDGAAGRLSANDALGQSGGTEQHSLTVSEMPAHNHGGATGAGGWQQSSTERDGPTAGSGLSVGYGSHTHPISNQGSGTPHNNMQPYQIVNWIIKT